MRRWLQPGAADGAFFLALVLCLIGGRTSFLNDPGTYWHLRLGQDIARTGLVPRSDYLTYTHAGEPWVDQSWAFDVVFAAIVRRWGWSGAVALTAVALAWIYGALAMILRRDGRTPVVALAVAIVAMAIGATHFLARPHLVTIALVLWTLRACCLYHEGRSRRLWWAPPVMVAWANLHGGFLAGPFVIATSAVGHAVSGPRDAAWRRRLLGFLVIFAACCVAPLANPYGMGLYRHVFRLLVGSGVTALIQEYKPIGFGPRRFLTLEGTLLALIVLPRFSRNRLSNYNLTQIVVWLPLGLRSIRQVPLTALAIAPGLAELIDGLHQPDIDPTRPGPRWSVWPTVATLGVILALECGVRLGWHEPTRWPLAVLPVLDRQPTEAHLFHDQDWGGLIEAECQPRRKAFLDDRFELYGRDWILDYIRILDGGPTWDAYDRRYGFGLVWVKPNCGLAPRLQADPGWTVLHRDGVSILFRRDDGGERRVEAGGLKSKESRSGL